MSSTAPAGHKSGIAPLLPVLLGVAVLLFWLLALMLQVQTSEAFILNGATVSSFNPDWSVLMQPVDLVRGQLSADMSKAVMWGWGIEFTFLICVVGYEHAHHALSKSSARMATWFRTGLIILIAFDGWADFQYGQLASGFWGQVAFALITAFIVMFFGLIGLRLIEAGFHEWSK
jgi:hypothetical protein